jgi:hypothetical protein
MPVTPTGNLAVPLHALRSLLIASNAWQTWCSGQPQAEADTYLISSPDQILRPHAIIDHGNRIAATRDGVAPGRWISTRTLRLYLAAPSLADATDADAVTDYLNHLDAVLSDLEQAAPESAGILILSYQITAGPERIHQHLRERTGDLVESVMDLDVQVWP